MRSTESVLEETLAQLTQAQAALRQSEAKYRSLIERASDGVVIVQDGLIKFVNTHLQVMTGHQNNVSIGSSFLDYVAPDERDKVLDRYTRRMRGETVELVYESALRHRDGARIDVEISGGAIEFEGRPADLILIRDIRDRKRSELEKRKLQEHLLDSKSLESVGRLAGGIAHDFNNILGAIAGYADMLRMRFADDNPVVARYTKAILDSVKRAADLTNKLLAFARKGKFDVAPTNLHHVIEDTVKLLMPSMNKNVSVFFRLEAEAYMVMGDRTQLQNAIVNVTLNACDAMPRGGELHFATESVNCTEASSGASPDVPPAGTYVELRITDTGTGISVDTRKHLFEPFFTTKASTQNAGLGLASVYGTVKSHNGFIEVESEEGKGTAVVIRLPVAGGWSGQTQPIDNKVYCGIGTVLIVDDEESVRNIASELLARLGYTTVTAGDGVEAVRYLAQSGSRTVDLAIIDMTMPLLGGRDCFRELRKVAPGLKVIVISGHAPGEEVASMMAEGALAFVQKPFDVQQFSKVVHDALAGGEA